MIKKKPGGSLSPLIFKVTSFMLYGALVIHFMIVGFNQFPDNPIKHQYKVQMNNYTDPFFSQAWTLFSPNPINTNMNLLIQFKYTNNNEELISDWIDVSDPIIKERENFFWSPAQRISKFLSGSMQNINDNYREFYEYVKETDSLAAKDSITIAKLYQKSVSATYGHISILQYSIFVSSKYFAGLKINPAGIFVRYKVFNAKFPRFSKRDLDYYDLKNYTYTQLSSDFYKLK